MALLNSLLLAIKNKPQGLTKIHSRKRTGPVLLSAGEVLQSTSIMPSSNHHDEQPRVAKPGISLKKALIGGSGLALLASGNLGQATASPDGALAVRNPGQPDSATVPTALEGTYHEADAQQESEDMSFSPSASVVPEVPVNRPRTPQGRGRGRGGNPRGGRVLRRAVRRETINEGDEMLPRSAQRGRGCGVIRGGCGRGAGRGVGRRSPPNQAMHTVDENEEDAHSPKGN